MNNNAVSLINVSKKFRLYNATHERFFEAFHPFKKKYHREFWALRDITLEIPKGSTIGIIGRNGSGKSTLLQIICSVLKPTTGEVSIHGRVSALLELGADFHPDFTGRENVIQKGIRMGFTEREMLERLPLIEEFADIGEFINQPVKIYSSGMFLRLAFSTAINVDPEILVVDEALAVGDAKFQHKCYQKFTEFQEKGKTIIFVTHSMEAVVRHCDNAVLLEKGKILDNCEPKTVVSKYLELIFTDNSSEQKEKPKLVEEGYRGFNIVNYNKKYFALSNSLGPLDLSVLTESDIDNYTDNQKCVVGKSIDDVKKGVNIIFENNEFNYSQYGTVYKSEFERFLNDPIHIDNCKNRRSYNKNEYRYGNKKADVIDYLIVAGGEYDPVAIVSGLNVEIYLKVHINEAIEEPIYGFVINTTEGIALYGTNNLMNNKKVRAVDSGEIVIVKFTQLIKLKEGDYFIDLGVGSGGQKEIVSPEDRRVSIIHFKVINEKQYTFNGFFDLETIIEEVK